LSLKENKININVYHSLAIHHHHVSGQVCNKRRKRVDLLNTVKMQKRLSFVKGVFIIKSWENEKSVVRTNAIWRKHNANVSPQVASFIRHIFSPMPTAEIVSNLELILCEFKWHTFRNNADFLFYLKRFQTATKCTNVST
jgi:hypothetical protein